MAEAASIAFFSSRSVIGFTIANRSIVVDVEQIESSVCGFGRRYSEKAAAFRHIDVHDTGAAADNFGLTGHGAVDQLGDSISNRDRAFSPFNAGGVHLVVGTVLAPDSVFRSMQGPYDPKTFGVVVTVKGGIAISDEK